MYDKRFREWNVFKNVNSDEKDRLIRRIHTTTPPSPSNVIDKDTISQEDLRKSIRCAKTIPQGLRRSSPTSPSLSSSSTSQSHGSSGQRPTRTGRGGLSISDLVKERDIARQLGSPETSEGQSPSAQASSPDIPVATPSSSSAWSDEHLPVSSVARSQTGSPAPQSLTVFKAQLQALAETPPPTIAPDAKSRSLEIITLSIRDYYDWQVQNIPDGVLPDDFLGHRSPEESTQYWSAIKNSIYLIKLSASSDTSERPDWRAWPALAEAGPLAGSAMTSQPFDFLRNVFATLSPANISARPELRAILLQFLTNEAQNKFTGAHPVPRILRELQLDQDCQEVSRRALQCMLDVFNQRLGRSRAVTFKLLDSLATLLRRNGEFDAAMEIVMELLNSCRQFFGHGSDQARAIENELAHFYMVANEHDLALDHCMSVVRRPTPAGPCQETELFYQDGIAAHTMEDIAEIHQRRGDIEQTITWLERAASIALKVWGPKAVATGHIIDKVATLQRQFGKDLLRSAMLWEARVIAE